MTLIHDASQDLKRLRLEYSISNTMAVFANRGFHALLCYRAAHYLYSKHIPLIPLLLSRLVQIFYSIDIDYRATLEQGIVIIHGVGLVVGQGAVIKSNSTIYHGVTLGRKGQGSSIPADDGYPVICDNCLLAAGVKIIGPVCVGENSVIGPNCVLMMSVPPNTIIKFNNSSFSIKTLAHNPQL